MLARTISFLAPAVLIAAACGGNGSDEKTETQHEDELARSMLLTINDFPAGWAEEPSQEEEESPFDKCESDEPAGQTGRAETGDFSDGDSVSISQTLSVFPTPDDTQQALDQIASDEIGDCLVKVVEDGELDTDEAEYSDASLSEVSFPKIGDETAALRFKLHAKAKGESGFGSEADVFIDVVSVIYDRVGFSITASDILSPYDTDELQGIVSDALAKVKAKLGDSASASDRSPSRTAAPSRTTPATQRTTVAPTPSPPPLGQSREAAVPVGQAVTVVGRLEAKVIAANLDAYSVVQSENSFNEPPQPGKRMVMVTLEVANVGSESLEVRFEPSYKLVGVKSVVYESSSPSCGVIPNPLEGELFPGGRKQGNVCFQADIDDSNLVIFVEMSTEDFDQERRFFAIQ